jgi:diapolycopene oxygenase
LGGMSAAITLATEGFPVALYEKNDKLGGKLNFAQCDGYSFDLGPSIIILPHLFRRLFERAGRTMEDYVQFQEVTPHWRSFFEDGTVIDLHPDMRAMEHQLEKLGTGADGYWDFIEYSRRLYKFAEDAYLERGADTIGEVMKGYSPADVVAGTDLFNTMHRAVGRRIEHPHLVDMLSFFVKYVGSSPYDAPALLNLLAYSQLGYGLWYVKGGMYNLARAYEQLMRDLGVELHLQAEVTGLSKERDRVTGLVLKDGRRVEADVVVSNMEVVPAYERLLGEKGLMMQRYRVMYEPAASGLVLHLGVKRKYPQLQHHNFFFSKNPREFLDTIHRKKQLPEDPNIYLVRPTKTDSKLAPRGHDVIKILPHVPYLQKQRFTAEDYRALRDRVLIKLERMGLENLRKNIVVEDQLVPDDLEQMYYSNKGSIYGVVSNWKKNLAFKAPKQSEKYKNLFFVGGSVNPGGGTCMVVLCGQNVGHQIIKMFGNG